MAVINEENYHDEQNKNNILKLRKVLDTLPSFCRDFFRGIEPYTSTRTRLAYAYDIRLFFEFLHEKNSYCHKMEITEFPLSVLDMVQRTDIEEYLDYMSLYQKDGKNITNEERGKARKLAALRSFYNYYFQSERIEKNTAALVPLPKRHEKEIIRLEPNEVAILLDQVEDGTKLTKKELEYHKKTKLRDIALLTLLLGTGIRVSECVGLDINDVAGTFRKYHTEYGLKESANAWLNEAVKAAEDVIANSGFKLYTANGTTKSYRDLFISVKPVTTEVMLAAVCDKSLSVLNDANWYWTSATYGPRLNLIRTFVNTYLMEDGTPFTDKEGYKTMVFMDEVKNRDKRLQQTIRMGDYKRIDGGVQTPAPPIFSYTYTGYQPIKYCLDDVFYDSGANNDNSIPLIRFAEVLLNYAEAKAELGVFTDADWEKTIGALRGRAGITGGLTARPTKADPYLQANYFPEITDPSLLEIRRERGIELVFEGLRFSDLLRWKKGNLMTMPWNGFYVPELDKPMDLNEDGILDVCFTMNENVENPISGVTYVVVSEMKAGKVNPQRLSGNTKGELTWLNNIPRVWEDKHYLYPIPDLDIIMNPNLTQNPGW